jgi:hypothetical protein
MSYSIVRHYMNRPGPGRVIARGLTLAEAQAHCRDPETSSRTATSLSAIETTHRFGPWFDGYREDV